MEADEPWDGIWANLAEQVKTSATYRDFCNPNTVLLPVRVRLTAT
jgi:hypothetical protein